MSPSLPVESSVFPSGVKTSPRTNSVWPLSVPSGFPVFTSHSRTVLSQAAEAMRSWPVDPSGFQVHVGERIEPEQREGLGQILRYPFSVVGILPAHWGLGSFFTATSMIGFIAGAGIVVRNSIILVDFIELRLKEGVPLDQAVIDAGAVRFRPMLLTAAAVVVGSAVILTDPVFNGLAISLMAGEVASLLLSRTAVPVLYHTVWKGGHHPVKGG